MRFNRFAVVWQGAVASRFRLIDQLIRLRRLLEDVVFFNRGNEMTDELNAALEQLKSGGHKISAAFIGPSGSLFIIIDGITIKASDAIRLADGDVTLEELTSASSTRLIDPTVPPRA